MTTKENEIKLRIKEIKQIISKYETVSCISRDLQDTEFNIGLYSDDLYLERSQKDGFVYVHDNDDDVENRISIEDLKTIIQNIANREIKDKYELQELEYFLNEEDDE
ncbi:hypothetical protein ABGV43_22405 [Paenibacillus amylolyticus]|uniref:hypothetical protein n=1 Tax=Paenibacillus amylolyticus TaxID=1451 RepID=UPI003242FCB1